LWGIQYASKMKKAGFLTSGFKLPDRDENSNFYRVEFPVLLRKRAHGEVIWAIDRRAGYKLLDLPVDAERRLTKFFEIPGDLIPVKVHPRLDRYSLAIRYRVLIEQGYFRNQADLARHLGVSRAWITKVMNEFKRERAE
jgi:hypothetical protein